MKQFLIAITIFILFIYSSIIFIGHIMVGGYISEKTEQKYLLNVDKYKWVGGIMYMSIDYRDSLASAALMPMEGIDMFHTWYIMDDVGAIRPGSKLSKKLDSIYFSAKNKLK